MEAEKNPLEAVRAMMIETLERSRTATQSYIDMVEKTMRSFPSANEGQIGTFRAYIERQVAANHGFVDKLLRANDFQEAFRIQAEYFQSQLKSAAEDAAQIGAKMAGTFNRSSS
jgi:phasin protein